MKTYREKIPNVKQATENQGYWEKLRKKEEPIKVK
jgi:hypothetical protein